MAEFFLELFSEEIPPKLQKNARDFLLENFKQIFKEKNLKFKSSNTYSTPNRLIILFEGLDKEIKEKSEEIRGPNINAPEKALEGFLRSNQITKNEIYKKNTEKGEFYFFKKKEKTVNTFDLLEKNIPLILDKISWKKSMKWNDFEMEWGRPLKSILSIFDNKKLSFKFYHLESSDFTFVDKEFEDKKKIFKNFSSYNDYFNKRGIIIDQNYRKKLIEKQLQKISERKNVNLEINVKLLNEVVDLVDQPHILSCKFDQKFLEIPEEILIITMQHHQKYFHTFDQKGNITNEFFVVANVKDNKGFIKIGNERVVDARLSDASFFWEKNKSQNLIKQISKLKSINYFEGLGSYFDKVQRMRKLGALISDEMLISKEKIELLTSICKIDLISDIVNEFPELQGVIGGYFASSQGFDKDISLAISEHYLPTGLESKVPKKPFSTALALTDKIDTLVGFFGVNQKPTSSKDPYALRRSALGIIRLILENKKEFKITDLIKYSISLYRDQGFNFPNEKVQEELSTFLTERLKFYMKQKDIRYDIVEASINSFSIDQASQMYSKALVLNRVIIKDIGNDIILSYKRASNILENELKNKDLDLSNTTDPGIFKNEYEKNLYKKIHELRKYFTSINKDEDYYVTLGNLANAKPTISDFFDNVIVNDEDHTIKKNRLELLQMLCKTFDNYINFASIESIK
tara:strand:+ start:12007 stop:14076 length:2070 start_codon:yes stop_codon:yes gene_type:complete